MIAARMIAAAVFSAAYFKYLLLIAAGLKSSAAAFFSAAKIKAVKLFLVGLIKFAAGVWRMLPASWKRKILKYVFDKSIDKAKKKIKNEWDKLG